MFFSTGFVPVNQYPGWLQPYTVAHQPISYAVDVMRGLSLGGPCGADGQNVAVVGGHRRHVRNTDGYRIPKGRHPVDESWTARKVSARLFSSS